MFTRQKSRTSYKNHLWSYDFTIVDKNKYEFEIELNINKAKEMDIKFVALLINNRIEYIQQIIDQI